MNKEELIQKYMKIFEDIDRNKLDFVTNQIDFLASYEVAIMKLNEEVEEEGYVTESIGGNGFVSPKKNPKIEIISTYQKSCNTIVKQLIDLVPASKKKSKLEELMND